MTSKKLIRTSARRVGYFKLVLFSTWIINQYYCDTVGNSSAVQTNISRAAFQRQLWLLLAGCHTPNVTCLPPCLPACLLLRAAAPGSPCLTGQLWLTTGWDGLSLSGLGWCHEHMISQELYQCQSKVKYFPC